MMRDYSAEFAGRVAFIKELLQISGAKGLIFGNSGGKDSALAGILCKAASENTVGVIMPCQSRRNFGEDALHARLLADRFEIETHTVDLTRAKEALEESLSQGTGLSLTRDASSNMNPRLRMITLYAIAHTRGLLVCGTGNRSEIHMGYFTKWGDGAYDFNPIGDLTVTEIYQFLEFLGAPREIIDKAPSAALYEGQTDEADMGVTYDEIDRYLETGQASSGSKAVIDRYHRASGHKRRPAPVYGVR